MRSTFLDPGHPYRDVGGRQLQQSQMLRAPRSASRPHASWPATCCRLSPVAAAAMASDLADSDKRLPAAAAAARERGRGRGQSTQQQPAPLPAPLSAAADSGGAYAGRLLIRRQGLQPTNGHNTHRGASSSNSNNGHRLPGGARGQQQQQQQQQQQHHQLPELQQQQQQHLQQLNRGFSRSLKSTNSLEELLLLLEGGQAGRRPSLSALDAVSVVGGLLWLAKSGEWSALQAGLAPADGRQAAQLRQRGLQAIQALLDRGAELVAAQQQQHQHQQQHHHHHQQQQQHVPGDSHQHDQQQLQQQQQQVVVHPAELVKLIWAASKLQQQRPAMQLAAAAALLNELYSLSTTEISRLIWALAAARVHPGDAWLLAFSKAAQAKFWLASPPQLATLAYGLARLGWRPPDAWIAAWLEASQPLLPAMSGQSLTNAAWGLACWRFRAPDAWLAALYAATSSVMHDLAPIGISQLCLALVTLSAGLPPPGPWLLQLLEAAEPRFASMELLQLCNFGWGLAQWGHCPPQHTMAALLEATQPLLVAATPHDLTTLLWVCNKLGYVPHQTWLELWLAAAGAALPRCEPQHLTTMSLVLGSWGLLPLPSFNVDFWRSSRARFGDFSAYQLSLLLWGLGRARRSVPQAWAAALLATFTQQLLQEATTEDACRLLGALATVSVKPSGTRAWVQANPGVQQQLVALCGWLQPQLGQVEPAWLVVLMKGLGGLGLPLQLDMVDALNDAAAQLGERLSPEQRVLLLNVLANLRRSPGAGSGSAAAEATAAGDDSGDGDE